MKQETGGHDEIIASTGVSNAPIDTVRTTSSHSAVPGKITSPKSSPFPIFSNPFAKDQSQSAPCSQQASSSSSQPREAVSTPSSSSEKQQKEPKKIPRPPNAWILYRSAKVKVKESDAGSRWGSPLTWQEHDLPTPSRSTSISGPSSSKTPWPSVENPATDAVRHQSIMSRKVADMWKAESEEVKKQYYELAKRKKEEHERMYPGYRYKPSKEPRNTIKRGKSVLIQEEGVNGHAKKSRAATLIEGDRPSSTAKTKGKGPLDLSIDIDAAERESPFESILDIPFSAILGKPCKSGDKTSYHHGLGRDALEDATMVVDGLIEQPVFKQERTRTGVLDNGQSSGWMMSPLPLTPTDGLQTAGGTDTAAEPWTAWIMDDPSRAEPSTPGNSQEPSMLTAPLTEPPPRQKSKRVKKLAFAKTESRVRNTARRKSTSGTGTKQQAVTAASTLPMQKRFKKAVISKEYLKAAEAKKSEAEKASVKEAGTESLAQTSRQTAGEHTMKGTGNTLETLTKSYDRDGVDSEVEEALLCADTLIESFANMAAWSPDQGWFTGLPYTAPADITSNLDPGTSIPNNWTLYSQPMQEEQIGQYDPASLDTQMMDLLQADTQANTLLPQIMQPSSFIPSVEYDDVVLEASRRLAEWDQLDADKSAKLALPASTLEEDWTLNDQEWDALLTQAIFDPAFSQAAEQGTPATSSKALDTPPESVWDLIHFDSLSQARTPASPPKSVKEEAPMIELHGKFTEEELREKLRQMTRSTSSSSEVL